MAGEERVHADINEAVERLKTYIDQSNKQNQGKSSSRRASEQYQLGFGDLPPYLTNRIPVGENGLISDESRDKEIDRLKTVFAGIDFNGDGLITDKELPKAQFNNAQAADMLQFLSKQFPNAPKKMHQTLKTMIDKTAKDGSISEIENETLTKFLIDMKAVNGTPAPKPTELPNATPAPAAGATK